MFGAQAGRPVFVGYLRVVTAGITAGHIFRQARKFLVEFFSLADTPL